MAWLSILFVMATLQNANASAGQVAFFVQGSNAKDTRHAVWLEGVWTHFLKQKALPPELAFGLISKQKRKLIYQAKQLFAEGKKQFENLDFDKATASFRKSIHFFSSAHSYGFDFRSFSLVWSYIGVTYLLNGKKSLGKQAFKRAILLNQAASLKGISDDQQKIQLFEEVRKAVLSAPKSSLQVTSSLPAAVLINGHYVGVTPLTTKLLPGTHYLVLRHSGYQRWGKVIALSGASFSLHAKLKKYTYLSSWRARGRAASVHTLKSKTVPEDVTLFASLVKAKVLVLAQVQLVKNGSFLSVQAAAYDMQNKKQLAAGGALVPSKDSAQGRQLVVRLLQKLLAGKDVSLGGWVPVAVKVPKKTMRTKGKSNAGVWIGVGVTLGVLAIGGGTVLALYLTQPDLFRSCPNDGGCIQLTIR